MRQQGVPASSRPPRRTKSVAAVALVTLLVAACDSIAGLGSFRVGEESAAGGSAAIAADAGCDDATASGPCYACAPTTDPQFFNACTSAQCVPFDDATRVTKLAPDASLPTVPDRPASGGSGGGGAAGSAGTSGSAGASGGGAGTSGSGGTGGSAGSSGSGGASGASGAGGSAGKGGGGSGGVGSSGAAGTGGTP